MQGEFDMSAATHAQQPALFTAMLTQFRADLSVFNAQCHGGSAADVPWICGDTTYYWKNTYATQYDTVYGGYKNRESEGVYFVPFMTDGNGVNTATNAPAEDPDIPASGYYGAASRTNGNQVSSNRPTHFSSWARRSIIPDRLATAILNAAGRTSVNRPGNPGECFICELRLPDHRFRWKHNKLFLLLPEEYGPAFPAIVDCYTSPPT